DIDLAPIGSRPWAGQRCQIRRQIVPVVRERVEFLPVQNQRVGIAGWIQINVRRVLNCYALLLRQDREWKIKHLRTGSDGEVRPFRWRESVRGDTDRVDARSHVAELVRSP